MNAASLERTLFGVRFQNPIVLASGTAGFGRELDGVMDLDHLGGLVTKAVSVEPRAGNAPPRVAEFRGGMLNAIGLANPGLAQVRAVELPWLLQRMRAARVLVNVVGFTLDEYAAVIAGLDDLDGITAYELNLSCPNTSAGGLEFGADAASVTAIVARCRRATGRPLVAKLSPVLPDIAAMALVARDAGADAVSVVNTLPGLALDPSGAPRLGNGNGGASGPALLPAGVLAVRRVRDRAPDLPIIGLGGVRSAEDARQYLAAGATLVGIGTGALADPRLPARIIRDLERHGG
ncbi:MAG TPA: dihydroorotate dehydrogenase [Gemmatimonadales bacterium]|nr:dihydroorotate dehydrogenase [Gemmatimonadales bacterium]